MKCKICNGELNFQNSVYVCESCGAQQTISALFENTEVFLCCIENDMQGRRSRDSVIAQDLYNKLEDAKIHSFYQRTSASDLTETDLETANTVAFDCARVVVAIAGSIENLENLIQAYGKKLDTKIIIPVYADMSANDIPQELKHLQAVNYDTVGAAAGLIKNVFRILGKEQEVDVAAAADKHLSRKKRAFIASLCVILVLIISASAYLIFGTPYILKSKKYEYAESLTAKGDYIDAIDIYSNLSDYKNSNDLLRQVYSRYNGYYSNQNDTISLYINISNNLSAKIKLISVNEDGEFVRFETETIGTKNMFSFSFQDSRNNQGTGSVELLNDGIRLIVSTHTKESNLFINDQDIPFALSQKTDAPTFNTITKDVLLSWLERETTIDQLNRRGYEMKIEDEAEDGCCTTFRIVNTDIVLAADESSIIKGITATADIVLPDNIGMKSKPYLSREVLYIPEAQLYVDVDLGLQCSYIFKNVFTSTISDSTCISMTVKDALTDENWNRMILSAAELEVDKSAIQKYPEVYNEYETCNVRAENETHYLCGLDLGNGNAAFYTVDKNFENVKFVAEVPRNLNSLDVDIFQYLQWFGEFIG